MKFPYSELNMSNEIFNKLNSSANILHLICYVKFCIVYNIYNCQKSMKYHGNFK